MCSIARCKERFGLLAVALVVASGMLLALPHPALAQNDARQQAVSDNLRQARERLRREEERLNTLRKNQNDLEILLKKLEGELASAQAERSQLEGDLAKLRGNVDTVGKHVQSISQTIETRRSGQKERAIAVYKVQRRKNAIDYLLNAQSATDLLKRSRYLSRVAEYDANYLQALAKLLETLKLEQAKFQQLQDDKTARAARLEEVEKEVSAKREKQAILLTDQREKIEQQEKMLGKMRESAEKLEQVLASIMGGEQPVRSAPGRDESGETVVTGPGGTAEIITTPYSGDGLAVLKGKLTFPVKGEILQRFGKHRHEEFTDIVFVKGLEMRCAVGVKVQAIHRGRVVMNQVLPGYGNVIIIDHGQRYYTLYGRLASSFHAVGQEVKAGEDLAVLGEPDYKGRNFYFELRVKGKATNPLEYFKNAPAVAAPS